MSNFFIETSILILASHPASTNTCRVTISPKVCSDKSFVYFCFTCNVFINACYGDNN